MADGLIKCKVAAQAAQAAATSSGSGDSAAWHAAAAGPPTEWRADPDADLVLSDVHIGRAPSAVQRCITHFCFRPGWTPPESSSGYGIARGPCSSAGTAGGIGACAVRDGRRTAAGAPASGAVGAELDEDGDVLVKRRRIAHSTAAGAADSRTRDVAADGFAMHHAMATSLRDVGKQVWRGALLLADLLLSWPQLVAGRTAVELGAGCGLSGIAAARAGAHRVMLTDLPSLLPQLQDNIAANAASSAAGPTSVTCHCLDWAAPPPAAQQHSGHGRGSSHLTAGCALQQWASKNGWSPADVRQLLQAEVLLAADTVYDGDITELFMAAAAALLQPLAACADRSCSVCRSPGRQQAGSTGSRGGGGSLSSRKSMYIALEKRYNFTLCDMDARASAFEHWLELFHCTPDVCQPAAEAAATAGTSAGGPVQCSGGKCALCCGTCGSRRARLPLAGRRLDVASVPYVLKYERGNDLELWELWAHDGL